MKKDNLSKVIHLRVSPLEYEILLEKSTACGLTPSAYIRQSSLGYNPKATFSEDELSFINMLHESLINVKKFNNAFREVTKDMTKEDRDKYVLDGKTITEWGKRIESVLTFFDEYKKHLSL